MNHSVKAFQPGIIALTLIIMALAPFPAQALPLDSEFQPDAAMLRYPDVGKEKIVFLFANDLWTVDRNGGPATPLASPAGVEVFPKFSADGETIAFGGNYDGNLDLYTLPISGGIPHRITHHPSGEFLCDWAPDGRLLFYNNGQGGIDSMSLLYLVSSEGGLPEKLPLPYGAAGAISPDGAWLAYTPHNRDRRSWKRYRGGMASDIWLFNLNTHESKKVTDWEGTDTLPMWHGKKLYYLSDRGEEHKLNIWVYEGSEGNHRQITRFADFDVKWPSIGPGDRDQGEIVFQKGTGLFLLDLADDTAREVKVAIPGARPTLRPKRIDAARYMQGTGISPTGKRVVTQGRGDIWTLPAEKGTPRNLTRTAGAAERSPDWSPDGKWIAYFSDATGEYELYITQSDGKGETRQLTSGNTTFFYYLIWSPDSKQILFADNGGGLFLHHIENKETKLIDQDPHGWTRGVSFTHDSRWIAFTGSAEEGPIPRIKIYSVETEEVRTITNGYYGENSPAFDRKGDYLYFTTQRVFTPTTSEINDSFIYKDTSQIMALPLRADMKWPWPKESDEEEWQDEDEEKTEEQPAEGENTEEKADTDEAAEEEVDEEPAQPDDGVTGHWEGLAQTPEGPLDFTINLKLHEGGKITGDLTSPLYAGEFTGTYNPEEGTVSAVLVLDQGMQVVLELKIDGDSLTGTGTADGAGIPITAKRIHGSEADEEEKTDGKEAKKDVSIDFEGIAARAFVLPISRGRFFSLAVNDKNQLLYTRAGKGIKLFDITDKKREEKKVSDSGGGFALSADGKKLLLSSGGAPSILNAGPGASAKKVPTDNMTAWIDPRAEWKQLFMETWRLFRDFFYVENMHGLDWLGVRGRYEKMLELCMTREEVSYVIREMIAELNVGHAYYDGGDGENPPRLSVGMLGADYALKDGAYCFTRILKGADWDPDIRSPLCEPGLNVEEGDYLLAVNGTPVDTRKDPYAAFLGLANDSVTLTVSKKPVLDEDAREVMVKAMSNEIQLRYRDWVEGNRTMVEEKTGGKVGYMHVPDTGWGGRNAFVRQYYGQIFKKALIVDERWNKGGYTPYCFIEMMNRPTTNFFSRRYGKDNPVPGNAHKGPKCMLINCMAGSGGDNLPWAFRRAGLGKLIGTRTWGGLVGLSGNPGLIDGGVPQVPTTGFFEIDGTWGVEGHGVDPDIEVIDDPALMVDGGDPQLEAAIALMLEEMETFHYLQPIRPQSPDRSGMGLPLEDR